MESFVIQIDHYHLRMEAVGPLVAWAGESLSRPDSKAKLDRHDDTVLDRTWTCLLIWHEVPDRSLLRVGTECIISLCARM
jgi:hypothetical protein